MESSIETILIHVLKQGDSGGPVVEIYRNRPIVHGIVSWGRGCGLATHPGVYTRVSRFLQWIPANQ